MDSNERIFQELVEIRKRLIKMEERIMAEIDDLNAAEATEQSDITALVAEQTKAFADLEAAITTGGTGPNLLPIIAQLQANHTALATALAAAQAADPVVTPPTPA